jgi:hypothetical protein
LEDQFKFERAIAAKRLKSDAVAHQKELDRNLQ